jgi:TonB family protein
MNPLFLSPSKLLQPRMLSVFSLTSLLLTLMFVCQIGQAQQTQLSLADILIGLRSKKATLPERNKLLSDAVKVRGVTFTVSTEIETELQNTGASVELLEAIRQRSLKTDAAPNIKSGVAVMAASFASAPPAKPAAPDSAFYQKRAYENALKGEHDLAVNDYSEAIKLNPKEVSLFINRGRAHQNKKNYDLAIADYNTAIELNPKEATAYFNRADSHEKKGNASQAMSDYQKVLELDANNESAKINLKRLQADQLKAEQAKAEQLKAEQLKAEQAKIEQAKMQEAAAAAAAKPKVPESVELGQLNALAVKLATPVYPPTAQTMNIQGKVTVQISLDEEGKVVSVKAINGHQFLRAAGEDAARRSKFKPTLVGNQAVKATGFIVYNFLGK